MSLGESKATLSERWNLLPPVKMYSKFIDLRGDKMAKDMRREQ